MKKLTLPSCSKKYRYIQRIFLLVLLITTTSVAFGQASARRAVVQLDFKAVDATICGFSYSTHPSSITYQESGGGYSANLTFPISDFCNFMNGEYIDVYFSCDDYKNREIWIGGWEVKQAILNGTRFTKVLYNGDSHDVGITIGAKLLTSLTTPTAVGGGNRFCADELVTIEATSDILCSGAFSGVGNRSHSWYYRIAGESVWNPIPNGYYEVNTNGHAKVKFSINSLAPGKITQSKNVEFKVESTSPDASYVRASSEIISINFLPPGPSTSGTITTEASCSNTPTGKITLPNITSTGNVRYILRKGAGNDNIGSCKLNEGTVEDIKNCLSNVEMSGILPANLTIENVKDGAYTLLLANDGAEKGACYNAYNVTVGKIDPLTLLKYETKNVTCPTGTSNKDGSVTLTFKDGTTPIKINEIKDVPSTHSDRTITISGLEAKDYVGTAQDICGTQIPLSFTIAAPPPTPTITISKQDPTCNNPGNGAVRVSITKGSPTQNIMLECYKDNVIFTPAKAQGDPDLIINLSAGSYKFVVYDNDRKACGSNQQICTLNAAPTLGISYEDLTDASCFGSNTGSFKLVGSGISSYKYSIDGLNWQTDGKFDNLSAKTYTGRVRRNNIEGCLDEATVQVEVKQPLKLGQTVMVNDIACYDSNGGSISIAAVGGVAPYTFILVDGKNIETPQTPSGNTYTFSNLDEDTYKVYVKDKNGCSTIATAHTLTRPEELLFVSAALTHPACYGDAGSISPNAGGGTTPYTFKYKKAEDNDTPGSWSSFTALTPIPAGQYNLKVVDANGCETSYENSKPVEIVQPSQPLSISLTTADYNGLQISCHGLSDGSITATAQGGETPYQYSINGTTYQAAAYFGTLSAGSYTVYVKDALGCIRSATVSLQQGTAPVSLTVADIGHVDCGEATNGYIQLNASGGHTNGTGIYSFRIEPDGAWQSSGTFNELAAGPYTISVKDSNGCSTTATATVISTGNLQVSVVSHQGAQCDENPNGWIALAAGGGSGTYQFAMDNGNWQNSPLFSNLAPGEHVCKVRDSNGCSNFILYNLPRISTLDLALSSITHTTCPLDEDATIVVQGSGGSGGYQYRCPAISNGWSNSGTFAELAVGCYTIEVKDTDGCTASIDITVTTQSTLELAVASVQHLACAESTIGVVEVTATGSSAYTYQINNGGWQNSSRFEGVGIGNHTLAVKDGNGCVAAVEAAVNVELPPLAIVSAATQDVSCHGGSNGSITVSATGGTAPYSYTLNDITQSHAVLNELQAGTHSITVTDAGGCTDTQAVEVKHPVSPLLASTQVRPLCPGYSVGEITVYADGGTPPYRYTCNNDYFTHHIISNRALGIHNIIVTDINDCTHALQAEVTRNDISPNVSFLVSTKQNAIDTLVVKEICTPIPDSIRWEFDPATKVLEDGEFPVIMFDQPDSYWVRLTAYYGGCDFTTEKTINIKPYDPDKPGNPDFNQGFESFIAFPNPSSGVFTIRAKLKVKQTLQLQLYNMSGKLFLNKTIENALDYEEMVAIPNLPSGTYILRGVTQNEARVFKLIVQ